MSFPFNIVIINTLNLEVSPINLFLGSMNVLHLVIFLSILLPIDSPFKKPIIKLHHAITRKVKTHAWFLKHLVNIALFTIVVYFNFSRTSSSEEGADLYKISSQQASIALYTLLSAIILQQNSENLELVGADRVLEIENEAARKKMVSFKPPSKTLYKTLLAPQEAIFDPEWTGLENIKRGRPALYVMNHSLYALEVPSFLSGLYLQKDVFVRGLADHFHFASPHGCIMKAVGAVDGTRANVDALMEAQQNILVYPGGGQEVLKHSSEPKVFIDVERTSWIRKIGNQTWI